jgi:uncharacterized protein YbaP (TraB family)
MRVESSPSLSTIFGKSHSSPGHAYLSRDSSCIPPHARLHEVLLVERNRNGIPEIEKFLATDRDVMFLVGAGHLVGEDSVVDLLREKGYEVMPLANGE